ncbi:hypothetical protein D8M04_03510 [Oceanobacillus piezotolerans]|uniref:Uncharacterized protein n=1 Tax=Oceanobacillus piezotolerans TaxID=2448030 RepID=A0A498DB34_9BACI|nr:hypothetical protein D8M04_03510 [Oceanobacillus piezotolerans]
MISILENILQVTAGILILCSFYFYRFFKKVKKDRKLNLIEQCIYIITQIAIFLCTVSYLLLLLDRNY